MVALSRLAEVVKQHAPKGVALGEIAFLMGPAAVREADEGAAIVQGAQGELGSGSRCITGAFDTFP
ncbi:MAG TPA: hypothetical protein PLK13_12610, partial [Xanthobacteraceae bacterium]|nr:hypothetical protein [Xanthobacteraceae bacterium]